MTGRWRVLLPVLAVVLSACSDNSQSTLTPSGLEARQIARLGSVLFAFGGAVFLLVVAAMIAAVAGPPGLRRTLAARRTVIGLGLIFPALSLLGLFTFSTLTSKGLLAVGDDPRQQVISVRGEQWWWRVGYRTGDGRTFESANEIHIPVGRPVVFELGSADVIHSFWIPSLGGKIDMIPGRTTRLRLTADRAGVYRGQCAEYCGGPHALMAFTVIAQDAADHAAWLEQQGRPARAPATAAERDGAALFIAAGCGACHRIDGTAAEGAIGPNLTRVGSRRSIGIDQNSTSHDNIVRFLAHGQTVKPHNRMPEFGILSPRERDAIATYLLSLR